jgi:hypothetical protein
MTEEVTKAIEKANRDLASLEEQREAIFSRAKLLRKERDAIAFAALTANDKKAKERLREINLEDVALSANVASVEAALTVARVNLAEAKAAEAQAVDRANALQIRELNKRFLELGLIVDDAFADVISASAEMREVLDKMRALGVSSPTHQQFNVMGLIACKTAVMNVPWSSGGREWEFLAPNQRKSFKSIALGWSEMIERQIAQRLGEDKKKDAA